MNGLKKKRVKNRANQSKIINIKDAEQWSEPQSLDKKINKLELWMSSVLHGTHSF